MSLAMHISNLHSNFAADGGVGIERAPCEQLEDDVEGEDIVLPPKEDIAWQLPSSHTGPTVITHAVGIIIKVISAVHALLDTLRRRKTVLCFLRT